MLSTSEAAERAGVPIHIIKQWAALSLLTNYGTSGKGGRALWHPDEVDSAPMRRKNLRVGWRGRAVTNAERLANRRLDMGIVPTVPHSLPYRALAWTCGKCGDLVSPTSIRRDEPRVMRNHRCDAEYVRRRRAEDEAFRLASRAKSLARYHRRQEASADGASRRGWTWTGPELEVAARPDLTAAQVAAMLGRTVAGVMWARKGLRSDPRKKGMV